MASPPPPGELERIDEAALRFGDSAPTGGGNADIMRCTYGGRQYVYKRFKEHFQQLVEPDRLARMVGWRRGLDSVTLARLDEVTSWPLAVVERAGAITGVLLRVAPPEFLLPDGPGGRLHARNLSRQPLQEADLRDEDVASAVPAALSALGLTARVLLWLHRLGVVVNDVQPDNTLVDEAGGRVYLVDCDSMIGDVWGSVAPASAPGYLNDVVPDAPSPAVDLAKLAWCAHMLLIRDFSLRSLSESEARSMSRFMSRQTAGLLAQAALGPDAGESWRRFWDERAGLWISANRQGALVLDSGWRVVAEPAPFTRAGGLSWLAGAGRDRFEAAATEPVEATATAEVLLTNFDLPEYEPEVTVHRPNRTDPSRSEKLVGITAAVVLAILIAIGSYLIFNH